MKPYSKRLVIATTIWVAVQLGGCAATLAPVTPLLLPKVKYGDAHESSYFWTAGLSPKKSSFDLRDYAVITRINDVEIPWEIVPSMGGAPFYNRLVEFPASELSVEILYIEQTILCGLLSGCIHDQKSRKILTFTARPDRIYVPFVNDWCSREYFWIEDWGNYYPGSEVEILGPKRSYLTHPTVAGETPPRGACQ